MLYFGSWERSWLFLLPPLPIGLPLYFLKRWHWGNPTITFPVFILVPLATFTPLPPRPATDQASGPAPPSHTPV